METYKGWFYKPGEENKKITGQLIINDDKTVQLDLLGGFYEGMGFVSNREYFTIWGDLFNGKKVTLFDSFNRHSNTVHGKSHSELYKIHLTLVGTHVNDRDALHFNELNAEIDEINDWIGIIGGDFEYETNKKTIYTYLEPDDIPFKISDTLTGSFYFRQIKDFKNDRELRFTEKTLINIKSNELTSVSHLIHSIVKLRKLLSYFIGRKVQILSMSMKSLNEFISTKLPNGREHISYETIHIYYNDNERYISEPNKRYDFLVRYEDIAEDFSNIIQRWFADVEEVLRPVTNILLDSLHYTNTFDETEFLFLFQGVEAFHRRCVQDTAALKENHQTYLKEKLEAITDQQFKSWLSSKLTFAYEPSARIRLQSIFEQHKNILIPEVDKKQYSLWIEQMVASRNYLTHFDPDAEHSKVDTSTLYHYTILLKALLAISILKHIGLDDEMLSSAPKTYSYSLDKLINDIR